MFDIIRCDADAPSYGFEAFFRPQQLRMAKAKDLKDAAAHRNKEVLIQLDDYLFDEGSVKLIAEKRKACFLIDVSQLILTRGVPRAILISKLRTFLRLCNKHGAFYAFATFSDREELIRTPDELISIAMLLGINKGQARFALRMLKDYP